MTVKALSTRLKRVRTGLQEQMKEALQKLLPILTEEEIAHWNALIEKCKTEKVKLGDIDFFSDEDLDFIVSIEQRCLEILRKEWHLG